MYNAAVNNLILQALSIILLYSSLSYGTQNYIKFFPTISKKDLFIILTR